MKMDNLLFQPFWVGSKVSESSWELAFGKKESDIERKSVVQHYKDGKWVDGKAETQQRAKAGKVLVK